MPAQTLPAASLRDANLLPAARVLLRAANYLICIALSAIRRAIFGVEAKFSLFSGRSASPGGVEQDADHRRAVDLARVGVDPAVVHRALGDMIELLGGDPDIAQPGWQSETRDQFGDYLGRGLLGAPQRLADPRLFAGIDRMIETQHVRQHHAGGV